MDANFHNDRPSLDSINFALVITLINYINIKYA